VNEEGIKLGPGDIFRLLEYFLSDTNKLVSMCRFSEISDSFSHVIERQNSNIYVNKGPYIVLQSGGKNILSVFLYCQKAKV
jgi:hypothetical protein